MKEPGEKLSPPAEVMFVISGITDGDPHFPQLILLHCYYSQQHYGSM